MGLIVVWACLVFLGLVIGRELLAWYTKMNRVVDLLELLERGNTRIAAELALANARGAPK